MTFMIVFSYRSSVHCPSPNSLSQINPRCSASRCSGSSALAVYVAMFLLSLAFTILCFSRGPCIKYIQNGFVLREPLSIPIGLLQPRSENDCTL